MEGSSSGSQDDIVREHAVQEESPHKQLESSNGRDPDGHSTDDSTAEAEAKEGGGVGGRETKPTATSNAPPLPAPQPPKPGFVSRLVTKLGLDAPTLVAMFKGAIPPTVALAIYQSDAVSHEFSTFGYIIGIISVLSLSILPRGKFVQTLIFNLIFLSVGSAVALLILWSALQARIHTQTTPDDPRAPPTYNSSQSAVSAVWLFANIWIVNTLRAKYPSLNVPVIVYSILTNISCTLSPQITSNAAFLSIVRRLFTAMLTGFAIATATALLVVPLPSRFVWTAQLKGMIGLLRGVVKQEKAYLQSLEREDMFAVPADICAATHVDGPEDSTDGESRKSQESNSKAKRQKNKADPAPKSTTEAKSLKETLFKLRLLTSKMVIDMPFAKRDIAYAKLSAKDLSTTMELFRGVVIPIHGIGTVIDIFQRLAEKRGWITTSETPLEVLAEVNEDKRVWNEVMRQLHEPFEKLSAALDEGLQHAGMLLEILPRPKEAKKSEASPDVEAKGDMIKPGDQGFAAALRVRIQSFRDVRGSILRAWTKEKGLSTDDMSPEEMNDTAFSRRDQHQLYILLYIERLMEAAGEGVLRVVEFADTKVADGTMKQKRLIVPKPKVLKKWIKSVFNDEDKGQENNADNMMESGLPVIYMGDSFAAKREPEHLPPTNAWQRAGNGLRAVSRFFSSEESAFGFRAACATLTVGIVAFLENTHRFFQEQRLVWAMIIIAIGMTQTSGQSIFGFILRVLGTLAAVILTLITWYIVDGRIAGIFVFMYLFQAFTIYFLLKYPHFIPAIILCMVTQILILGYELQVLKIGIAASEASGQPFYPIYELAPYRLATVAGGCAVSFFWTIFPAPVTERAWLRRDLAATLYLLANYFSVIHSSLKSKLNGTGGDRNVKGTPAHHLAKQRVRLFGKLMLLLPSLKEHADFQKWEPTVGGKFPRELYEDIIQRASRINSYLTLLSFTIGGGGKYTPGVTLTDSLDTKDKDAQSTTPPGEDDANARAWRDALGVLLRSISPTQHGIISTLTLLSNALQSGHSIPPHLKVPRPYDITLELKNLDAAASNDSDSSRTRARSDASLGLLSMSAKQRQQEIHGLLDPRNMTQAGYAEFAVLQVCCLLVCDDLDRLVDSVSKLVGVVDFSYCVGGSDSTTGLSDSSSSSSAGGSASASLHEDGGRGKGKVD
ncbi:hypothetical protein F4808DRAFT_206234 [Astrocystis sublimbata]|nr:hypothetical protein F4808DRAFT_206234 [Astrocystis sublimbata]